MNHKFRREYYVCNEQKNDRGCSGNYPGKSLSACSNWSKRDRNTAIGAGAGALGGAVLTDGSTLGTLGGAAVGGVIGHQVGK